MLPIQAIALKPSAVAATTEYCAGGGDAGIYRAQMRTASYITSRQQLKQQQTKGQQSDTAAAQVEKLRSSAVER
jgi:hypothetical protein